MFVDTMMAPAMRCIDISAFVDFVNFDGFYIFSESGIMFTVLVADYRSGAITAPGYRCRRFQDCAPLLSEGRSWIPFMLCVFDMF